MCLTEQPSGHCSEQPMATPLVQHLDGRRAPTLGLTKDLGLGTPSAYLSERCLARQMATVLAKPWGFQKVLASVTLLAPLWGQPSGSLMALA